MLYNARLGYINLNTHIHTPTHTHLPTHTPHTHTKYFVIPNTRFTSLFSKFPKTSTDFKSSILAQPHYVQQASCKTEIGIPSVFPTNFKSPLFFHLSPLFFFFIKIKNGEKNMDYKASDFICGSSSAPTFLCELDKNLFQFSQ